MDQNDPPKPPSPVAEMKIIKESFNIHGRSSHVGQWTKIIHTNFYSLDFRKLTLDLKPTLKDDADKLKALS